MKIFDGGSFETLSVGRFGEHIVELTLDRPAVLNAIDTRLGIELGDFFEALPEALATDLRTLVLTGSGPKAFCAGADLKERQGMSDEAWNEHHAALERAFAMIRHCPVPIIAAVEGAALGGGCELVLACDLVVASETAFFGQPEVRRGIIPGCGATWALPRRIGASRAREMIFTGRRIGADEAAKWGLVNCVAAAGEALASARSLAEEIVAGGPIAVREAKRAIDRGLDLSREEGIVAELEGYRRTIPTEDRREGIRSFNQRRPPRFRNC